jgi:coniferyl-aldehyde dehydrogenase
MTTTTTPATKDWVSFTDRSEESVGNDETELNRLQQVFSGQQQAFLADPYPSIEARVARLQSLAGAIMKHRTAMQKALQDDFITHPDEFSDLIEILGMVSRIHLTIETLTAWAAPQERPLNQDFWGSAKGYMLPQPKGVILNMAPWNFPYDIGIGPIIEMIAAGNRVVVKPSDLSPHTGEVYRQIVEDAFPDLSYGVRVVEIVIGGLALSKACVSLPWDHLLYTGGTAGAKAVMRACAENLVPLTLELGGKCPAILGNKQLAEDPTVIDEIMGTKMIKNGQMCVSVDYVMIPEGSQTAFVAQARKSIEKMAPLGYTRDPNLPSIITDGHADRIAGLVADAQEKGFEVIQHGVESNDKRRPPFSFIINPTDDALVMQEEIFGPVLPVKTYASVEDAVKYVQQHDRPLSVSLWTDDTELKDRVIRTTHSGGFNHNAGTSMHAAQPQLGFGGSGQSGMGRHHGYEGFMEFSNLKAVFEKGEGGIALENGAILLAPYNRPETQATIAAMVEQLTAATNAAV